MKYLYLNKNIFFYILLLFVIIGLIIASILSNKQDDSFKKDYLIYNQMVKLYEEQRYEDVITLSKDIMVTQNDSEVVNYMLALSHINLQQPDEATIYMQRALDLNPYKIEDPIFMIQFAQILIESAKYENALKVLVVCESLQAPEEFPNYGTQVSELKQIVNEHL